MIRKTALLAGAVLALSVMTAPVALAQDDSTSCDVAKDSVAKLEKKLDVAVFDERVKETEKRDEAKRARDAAQVDVDEFVAGEGTPTLDELKRILKDAKETLRDAQEKLNSDSNKLVGLRAQVTLAIAERDEVCGGVTTTPATPEPENDVDCDEVGASEAQRILDADRNDPHNLDQDNDGIACEIDEVLVDDDDDEVVVPSGGVATGGGPA
jgi:hypothetical protein